MDSKKTRIWISCCMYAIYFTRHYISIDSVCQWRNDFDIPSLGSNQFNSSFNLNGRNAMLFKAFCFCLYEVRNKKLKSFCWMLGFNDSAMSKMMTVGVGHSRRYCNTGYDQSQGRRPSTLRCIGSISRRRYRAQPSVRN